MNRRRKTAEELTVSYRGKILKSLENILKVLEKFREAKEKELFALDTPLEERLKLNDRLNQNLRKARADVSSLQRFMDEPPDKI